MMQREKISILLEIISFFFITTDLYGKERIVQLGKRLRQITSIARLYGLTQRLFIAGKLLFETMPITEQENQERTKAMTNHSNDRPEPWSLFLLSLVYLSLVTVVLYSASELTSYSLITRIWVSALVALAAIGPVLFLLNICWLVIDAVFRHSIKNRIAEMACKVRLFVVVKKFIEENIIGAISFTNETPESYKLTALDKGVASIFLLTLIAFFGLQLYYNIVSFDTVFSSRLISLVIAILVSAFGTSFIAIGTFAMLTFFAPIFEILADALLGVALFALDKMKLEGLLLIAGTILFLCSKIILLF